MTVRFEEFPTLIRRLPRDQVRFEDQLSAEARDEWGLGRVEDSDVLEQSQAGRSGEVGVCGVCRRRILLTAHHLIPKSEFKRHSASLSFLRGPENILMCCRPCHSQIHRAESNYTLAEEYYTRELILAHPKIQAFACWVGKQSAEALQL